MSTVSTRSLVISVRFHDGRYHGSEDGFKQGDGWPPSPGRLFQALVAGAARGGTILPEDRYALSWLEKLQPPRVAAPASRRGASVPLFVPNNDLDSVGGHPDQIAKIRVGKAWRPYFFDLRVPVLYVWKFDVPAPAAERVCAIACRIYQVGRGIDMAAASGTIMECDQAQAVLAGHPGVLRRPSGHSSGHVAVARNGTLDSLVRRHKCNRNRLSRDVRGKTLFVQPPKALFRHIDYAVPPRRLYFELRRNGDFAPRPLDSSATVITGIRDAAAERLENALPRHAKMIERLIVGRGAGPSDIAQRIRLIPIPSIGVEQTDPSIRRVLVEVPTECPIRWDDIEWAFAGIEPRDLETGEILPGRLVSKGDPSMAGRYIRHAHTFRSVTAVALSSTDLRPRRIPSGGTSNDAGHRQRREARAATAVVQALRHAGVHDKPSSIHVQREPLHRRGVRAGLFADGSRFSRRAMWHVELQFQTPVAGPLVIGDGRFCGLGLMEPVPEYFDVVGFDLGRECTVSYADGPALVYALRRALMALAASGGSSRVDRLFSGHDSDGRPDTVPNHSHVFLAADSDGPNERITRLVVAAPWAANRRIEDSQRDRRRFHKVVYSLSDLRAGTIGRFRLHPASLGEGDPVIGPARTWIGKTPYVATRNLKRKDDLAAVVQSDVTIECRRRGLPVPNSVDVLSASVGPRGGHPCATIKLQFAIVVRGPILLGRDSHSGGGLFHARMSN